MRTAQRVRGTGTSSGEMQPQDRPIVGDPSDRADGPAVRVESMRVVRGGDTVVDDLSFGVARGEIVGLLGPSGCGKSTLMRALVGVQRHVSGTCELLGRPAGSPALRTRVGYVTQEASVYGDLTVVENLLAARCGRSRAPAHLRGACHAGAHGGAVRHRRRVARHRDPVRLHRRSGCRRRSDAHPSYRVSQPATPANRGPARSIRLGSSVPRCCSTIDATAISSSRSIAGRQAERVEQVDEVLGAHVAGGARRERTAAEAADARIESADAGVEPGGRVGQRETAGVVEMEAELDVVADPCSHGGDDRRDVVGCRAADRVGQHDLECARRRRSARRPGRRCRPPPRPRTRSRTPPTGRRSPGGRRLGRRVMIAREFVDRIGGRHPHVAVAERVARRDHADEHVDARHRPRRRAPRSLTTSASRDAPSTASRRTPDASRPSAARPSG